MLAFLKGLLIGSFLLIPTVTYAGGYGRSYGYGCQTCAPYVAPYVSKQVNVQYANAFVTFVPSQVLLNGQVVTYGNYGASGSIGYSYQGATVAAQPPLAGPPQQAPPGSVEDRLSRIESVLAQLAGEQPPQEGNGEQAQSQTLNPEGILKRHCGKCHSAGGSGFFSLPLFQQGGGLLQALPRLDIYESISKKPNEEGYMPKGNNPLSPAEKEVIRVWVQEGLRGHSY